MQISRRTLLAGTAGAAATVGLGSTAPGNAAAPVSDRQAPGVYRYKVGDAEVTVVADGARTFKLEDGFIPNAKREDINKALEAAYMPKDQMTIVFNPIVVNTGGKLVLIDTGNGPAAAKASNSNGQLMNNLKAAGIDPKAIDLVVISHFHGDHVNGLVTADGGRAFPNAEVTVPAVEWKFWMDDGEMARAPKGRMEGLFKNNRRIFDPIKKQVTQYEWGKDVAPGIKAIGTIGHTPGHTSYVVSSGDKAVFVQSDVTNHPALFTRHPDWHAFFDQDPAQAETTRRKVYDMLATDKMLLQGFHYPFPSLAHIEKVGNDYREVPAPWSPAI
jgi:glyoxylase-like metal-dependent hydrolase (beta-lactamase superfamily II)